MSSFVENLYLKRALQQLQEENRQLKDILEAARNSDETVEQIAPEFPWYITPAVTPSSTSPVKRPFRIPKLPPILGRAVGGLGAVGGVLGAAQLGWDAGTWINDTFIDPMYRPAKPTPDQLRPLPDHILPSPESLYPTPSVMPWQSRASSGGGGKGGGSSSGGGLGM